MLLDRLQFWRDPIPRSGPENMAVDEWLLQTSAMPVLRSYEWEGDWLSVGYFGRAEDALSMMQGDSAALVRRGTGGGIVDHRIDRTYTLVIPRSEALANLRGAESYRLIHEALAGVLGSLGFDARLVEEDQGEDSAACFEKPVAWDIVDSTGRKLAGAGQRRTRRGLLHQGSVVVPGSTPGLFRTLGAGLGKVLAEERRDPSEEDLAALREKFASPSWRMRR